LEFTSKKGDQFCYWLTAAVVIDIRSWTYKGDRYHEVWFRNEDGREWRHEALPLRVPMTKGQQIAFAWCAPSGQARGQMVAVRNLSTGRHNVLCQDIATWFRPQYGWRAFACVAATAGVLLLTQFMDSLPAWLPAISVSASTIAAVASALAGFLYSCTQDPDPCREIDSAVQVELEAMQLGWTRITEEAAIAVSRPPRSNQGRRRTLRAMDVHALR
jgi:hypothetical protein